MSPDEISTKYRLSKSKIAAFEHCPKRLWLQIHRRELGEFDAVTLARFAIGHQVGDHAQTFVEGGVLIEAIPGVQAALAQTAQRMAARSPSPLFEATFQREDVLVRVDILEPDGQGGWRAVEVKATTRVKPYHLADLATQIWVMRGCGVQITGAAIRHLAQPLSWTRPDFTRVSFQDCDVTVAIERFVETRAPIAADARETVRGPEVQRDIGPHCRKPFSCEFQVYCAKR